MNYYNRHIGDYTRDTAHLSLLEHGVYTLLLDRYYATEQPIPADQAQRIARARTRDEKAAVEAVLAEFFVRDGDAYRNGRADEEIEKLRAFFEAQRENGKKGGRPKKVKTETQQKPMGLPRGNPDESQSKAHQTPDTRHTPDRSSERTRDARTHAPEIVGQFEGHPEAQAVVAPTREGELAKALNGAGFRCTSINPVLVAYAEAGGTSEHLLEVAAHSDCAGKAATYVLKFALREWTEPRHVVSTGPPGTGRPSEQSKTLQALHHLQDMIPDERSAPPQHQPGNQQRRLADDRDRDRVAEAAHALAGSLTRR